MKVSIDLTLFSECRHCRVCQLTEAVTRCPTCEISLDYTESETQERFVVYLSMTSINEKPKFRKILNMVLALHFFLHVEAFAFNYRKHF